MKIFLLVFVDPVCVVLHSEVIIISFAKIIIKSKLRTLLRSFNRILAKI